MSLTEKTKKEIRKNRGLRAELIKENDIVEWTLLRWLREDHVMLTTKANLLIIEKYTKLTEAEILEPVTA